MKNENFLKSLKVAIYGLKCAFKEETILVVLSLELINSQIEKFLDIIQPEHHPRVKIIKDFSAGAVLISVIGSIIIGFLIFWPHIIEII
ncbi:MAG: diacylglycerol kinase [Candidatus Staskawiczbacteria bacterium]|nr:diacylglycerol kinase [Candidatus Staskawiczbacteria bacterium]